MQLRWSQEGQGGDTTHAAQRAGQGKSLCPADHNLSWTKTHYLLLFSFFKQHRWCWKMEGNCWGQGNIKMSYHWVHREISAGVNHKIPGDKTALADRREIHPWDWADHSGFRDRSQPSPVTDIKELTKIQRWKMQRHLYMVTLEQPSNT